MMTYGQFAWYEPLWIALMMWMNEVVVIVILGVRIGWLVGGWVTIVDGCKWKGGKWAMGRYL
jgi:hypothetical protein